MNWVAPIKDDETLRKFKDSLKQTDEKYYLMFEIGVGTGMQVQDILKLKNKDVSGKDQIEAYIGTKHIKRTFRFPDDLKKELQDYTKGKEPDGYLITGFENSPEALSREQAYRALKNAGLWIGLTSIGAQTMRKTFAWRYYRSTMYICPHCHEVFRPSMKEAFFTKHMMRTRKLHA